MSQWHRNASRHDGLQTRCKPCQIETVARSRERNREVEERARRILARRYPLEFAAIKSDVREGVLR